jgi:hypothetical protein
LLDLRHRLPEEVVIDDEELALHGNEIKQQLVIYEGELGIKAVVHLGSPRVA